MRIVKKNLCNTAILSFALLGAGNIVAAPAAPAAQVKAGSAAGPNSVFAKVGDTVITRKEYDEAFGTASRGKFYHGKPPENEIAILQREVGDKLVARVLLLREAKRRGLHPEGAEVQKTVQSYEKRYANSEQWKKSRAQVLPGLTARLEEENLLSQLENATRASAKADMKDAKAYFLKHPEKFTEPEKLRVSAILLKVDPSSPKETWIKADDEAKILVKRLRGGADFAELARLHSADPSAKQGGDMGYLHAGMLPDGTQAILAKLKPGELTDTVRLLEGVAVFRMVDRKPAQSHGFEEVKVRAQELAQRDQSEAVWNGFIAELKKKSPAQIDQSGFLPLAK
ncbi:MAG: peptidylprolyl isomerase [Polaromonas sp.]